MTIPEKIRILLSKITYSSLELGFRHVKKFSTKLFGLV